ncbi:hypothetical protein [Brevifollis gellanilyticus]|uniref:Uncharacterized protein n=1 Tax=Brevifollis gellanilyticus TaxID=748831 RepID=A0A512M7H8_9BACT|nr:hypothetical protein [Brevifollis gellanilyticus]GEP42690.1 hypothetical protein BGE01nite_19810 [Brevifollis gellanilyticus]
MDTTQQRIQTFFTAALAVLVTLFLLLVTSCNKKSSDLRPTTGDKIENKIDDALDRRPGEPVLDALENATQDPALKLETDRKIQNKVDDALDRRPGEPVLDVIEEGAKDVKKIKTAIQEAVRDADK